MHPCAMSTQELQQSTFDAYFGDGPIGGACAIWLQGSIRILTAYHVSHETKTRLPRALTLRNRAGDVTLRNIAFEKVAGSRDISLSEPVAINEAFTVATHYTPDVAYVTLGSSVSLLPPTDQTKQVSEATPLPLRRAPRELIVSSLGQRVDFGFSGKPVIDPDMQVIGVISAKRWIRGRWYGVAEVLRQRIFQNR